MTEADFDRGIARLTAEYGSNHFKAEKLKLIWGFVAGLGAFEFDKILSHFLASMRQAPLPKDFQEASRAVHKNNFNRDVVGAAAAMNTPWPNGLKPFLLREYPGCKTMNEAVQVQIEKNKIALALAVD